ncbi:MAG: hypothetical protein ACK4V1_13485 [Burkholderiaceae bacterium]
MDDKRVYTKTAKGVAEVAARGGVLSLSARRILIMVDGKRSVADLAPLARPGEIDGLIATLEAQGFIQRMHDAEPAAAASTRRVPDAPTVAGVELHTLGSESAEERTLLTLDEAKRRTVRALTDRLGPDAEVISMRIEQCRTADELRERVKEAERIIGGLLGQAAVADFVRALRGR